MYARQTQEGIKDRLEDVGVVMTSAKKIIDLGLLIRGNGCDKPALIRSVSTSRFKTRNRKG